MYIRKEDFLLSTYILSIRLVRFISVRSMLLMVSKTSFAMNCQVVNPSFANQTKSKINNASLRTLCSKAFIIILLISLYIRVSKSFFLIDVEGLHLLEHV